MITCKFEGKSFNIGRLIVGMICRITEVRIISKVSMQNSVYDLIVIKSFSVQFNPRKAPKILEVKWHPPLLGWLKCNTDGLYKAGVTTCVGFFRDCATSICGVFVYKIGIGNCRN